jgi:hypothetical protein
MAVHGSTLDTLEDRGQKIGRKITVSKNMCTVIAMHPIHNARDDLIVKRVSRAISVAQYLDRLAAAQRTSVERNTRLHGFFPGAGWQARPPPLENRSAKLFPNSPKS